MGVFSKLKGIFYDEVIEEVTEEEQQEDEIMNKLEYKDKVPISKDNICITRDIDKCIKCGKCLDNCAFNAITKKNILAANDYDILNAMQGKGIKLRLVNSNSYETLIFDNCKKLLSQMYEIAYFS